jgi:hypothetical protein
VGWATERLLEVMATKGQMSGMRGVYLAAAELARQGWIVSPTSRGAAGADILMTTHDCNHAYSVQVKTDTTNRTWFLLGSHAKSIKSDSHIYVLIRIKKKKDVESIDYYVVPSKILAKLCERANPNWQPNGFVVRVGKLAKYESNWIQLGDPQA